MVRIACGVGVLSALCSWRTLTYILLYSESWLYLEKPLYCRCHVEKRGSLVRGNSGLNECRCLGYWDPSPFLFSLPYVVNKPLLPPVQASVTYCPTIDSKATTLTINWNLWDWDQNKPFFSLVTNHVNFDIVKRCYVVTHDTKTIYIIDTKIPHAFWVNEKTSVCRLKE